ncbi:MAG: outer membrane protein [Alphaproteobacteria bacterium]
MSFNKFLLSVSAAALLAGPAFADGGPVPEPAPPPPPPPPAEEESAPPPPPPAPAVYDWTGVYAGVQIGYAFGDADHTFIPPGAPPGDSSPDGILGGAHIGYQVQGGSWVYGIEGDFDYTDVNGEFVDTTGATSSGSTDINYQGTLRFRLGHAADRLLIYATGGAAFADVDYGGGPAPLPPCCGFTRTTFGWTAGGGGEYAFTDSLSARLEYRYTDYEPETDSLTPLFPGTKMEVDMALHTIYAGLTYHF